MSRVTLRLTRRWSLFVAAPYDVVVDDRRIGSVRNRETVEFVVPAGTHTIQLRTGRFCSVSQSFAAYGGADVAFWCAGVHLWPVYLIALFRPQLGITLRQRT